MKDSEKPFLDHLEDLRGLLLKCAAAIAGGSVLGVMGIGRVMEILRWPLAQTTAGATVSAPSTLLALQVTDPMTVTLQIGIGAGILLSLPLVLFFLGQYLLPALDPRERGMLLPVFFVGTILFLGGVLFCYFLVLPQTLRFFQDFNRWLGLETSWTMASYTDFVLQMLVGFGLSFELPLVMVILARLGILEKKVVSNHRRHAVVALLVVAACVTPTSDPFNLALMFVPLYALFELGLAGMGWAEHRSANQDDSTKIP
ncbi:MAG: twin-arginine translocase subunit TatC [Verrucomicrobia bacterium]|nr:twin-arginine translocase subunit TatC [Pseudomonadota bacterium]NBS06124.1 twin-arginine translocase subunit TatC [Verrucomicrobiota bacterium]NBS78909.1 twin-arginine translocase subunit TatC [bacterium]NBS49413.1 twin-arginine translocase subunit TatC [Verrucomicrobiota bacterium]NBT23594.1 twin-arginine translocase subunit TatC [bacterium]